MALEKEEEAEFDDKGDRDEERKSWDKREIAGEVEDNTELVDDDDPLCLDVYFLATSIHIDSISFFHSLHFLLLVIPENLLHSSGIIVVLLSNLARHKFIKQHLIAENTYNARIQHT